MEERNLMKKSIISWIVIGIGILLFFGVPLAGILVLGGYFGFWAIKKYKQTGLGVVLLVLAALGGILAGAGYFVSQSKLNDRNWLFMASDHAYSQVANDVMIAKIIAIVSLILAVAGVLVIVLKKKSPEIVQGKYCIRCGSPLALDASFCSRCGQAAQNLSMKK